MREELIAKGPSMAKDRQEPDAELDHPAHEVIGAAIEVHRALGPGYLEVVYRRALAVELRLRGLSVQEEEPVAVSFKGVLVGEGRIDLWVGGRLVVELKTVETLNPIFKVQTRSYIKAKGEVLGLLINFNVEFLRDGIVRVVDSS